MRKFKQRPETTIHCCVCLQQGKNTPAFTVVRSYAVCEKHVQVVSRKTFDLFDQQERRGASV